MLGIHIFESKDLPAALTELDKRTREWELRAAKGLCSWVCADCCITFPEGMPDECPHGHDKCTSIIKRDKDEANAAGTEGSDLS